MKVGPERTATEVGRSKSQDEKYIMQTAQTRRRPEAKRPSIIFLVLVTTKDRPCGSESLAGGAPFPSALLFSTRTRE
jgi:hypothetical protein